MVHGVLNVYKEKGYTSHDVVAKLRGIIGQKKIGHTGTLDPDAVGVLPVCLGRATRLCDMLTEKDKIYETTLLLGRETDTQDVTGTTVGTCSTDTLRESMVRRAIGQYIGEYHQIPPMYSALKVGGKKLYELAREGKVVERKPRKVEIYSIDVMSVELPRVRMRVHCSKGTYIRTLCHDIGQSLQCGGCMEELKRTKVSRFEIQDSLTLSEIEQYQKEGRLNEILIPIDKMFEEYTAVVVDRSALKLAYNGNAVPVKNIKTEDQIVDSAYVRLYNDEGVFIGVYQYRESMRLYKLIKMFYHENE